jgi:penicillin-insensitive murein endopeptidase
VRWGLEPLVSLIDRAARMVHKQFPDAVMSVGHLSRPGGGEIDRHHSHESGRDADIGFFVRSQTGKPVLAPSFLTFKPDGTATHNSGAHFDEAQNWAFVQAVLTDPGAHVSYLFVASPLRARLLAHAERIGAPSALRVRAAEVMVQPRGVLPHDDHFHVRIACPSRMAGCIENPTPLTKPGQAKAKVPGRHRDHSKGTKRLQHHSRFRPAEPAKPVPRPEPEDRDLILSTPSSDDDADGSP